MEETEVKKTSAKKKFKLAYKIIAAVFSLLVSALTLIALLIFDPYENPEVYKATNRKDIYDEAAVLSTSEITKSHKISYELDNGSLNELMNLSYLKYKDINAGTKLKKFYIEESNEGYNFVFEAKLIFNLFKTRLIVNTTLVEDESGFVFKVNSMNAGRLNVSSFVRRKFNDAFFNEIFKDMDLSIVSDLSKDQFTYSYEDIIDDYRSRYDFGDNFFKALFDEFTPTVKSPFLVEANVNLHITNENYIDPNPESTDRTDVNMKDFKSGLAFLIQNNKNYKPLSNQILKYFLKGYDELTNEEKANIDRIDFSDFSITDNSSYKGIEKPKNSAYLVPELVKGDFDIRDHSSYVSGSTYEVSTIYEANINKTLRTSDALFKSTSLACNTYASTYAITDFYTEILNDHIDFIYQIDLDGLKTNLILDFIQNDPDLESTYRASFNLDKVYYGEKLIKSDLKNKAISFFKESLESCSNNGYMSFNEELNTLTLNFKSFVESSIQSDYFLNYGKGIVKSIGSSLHSAGSISLNFKVA